MSVERVKVNQYVPFSVIESYFLKGSFYKMSSEVKKRDGENTGNVGMLEGPKTPREHRLQQNEGSGKVETSGVRTHP